MLGGMGPGTTFVPQIVDDQYKGGEPPEGGMEARLTKLEARSDVSDTKLDAIQSSLERIEGKQLTQWDMAKVVFVVVGALMTAAIFGPRIVSMVGPIAP